MVQALDRVLDILRSSELYSPHLKMKEDPVTNDLVGGLMTVSMLPSQSCLFLLSIQLKFVTHNLFRLCRLELKCNRSVAQQCELTDLQYLAFKSLVMSLLS